MQLIYLAPVPWQSFAQRPHKFVEWFHARTGGDVLWLDPYPTRLPVLKDLLQGRSHHVQELIATPPTWLKTIAPGGLPIEPLPFLRWINVKLWQESLQLTTDFAKISDTLVAIGKPSALALAVLNRLDKHLSLYDAMDDFPEFYSGLSRRSLAQHEQHIVQKVRIVWASSSSLKARWETLHNNVHLVNNAVDALATTASAAHLRPPQGKIFGYVGTIASWFDWDWVRLLAEKHPDAEVRLVGPIYHKPNQKLPPNISLIPACDHAAAMQHMKNFHVGIIPFKDNPLTASVDPIKYYEYRAAGLPVISTAFGEMSLRHNEAGVFIAHSGTNLHDLAKLALAYEADPLVTDAFVENNSWAKRFDCSNLPLA